MTQSTLEPNASPAPATAGRSSSHGSPPQASRKRSLSGAGPDAPQQPRVQRPRHPAGGTGQRQTRQPANAMVAALPRLGIAFKGGITLPADIAAPHAPQPAASAPAAAEDGPSVAYSAASLATVRRQEMAEACVGVPRNLSSSSLPEVARRAADHLQRQRPLPPPPAKVSEAMAPGDLGAGPPLKYRRVDAPRAVYRRSNSMPTAVSPQTYLDALIKSRGYSTATYCSLESGYYCRPAPLQKASYGMTLIRAVRSGDAALLSKLLRCGLSPNPCNAFGESVVHMACRRGDHRLLEVLIKSGCSLQVSDDFGRTPLHDACWTSIPSFETVEAILDIDVRLLHVVDCRGASPLTYVKRENWGQWIDFLEGRKDKYWKPRDRVKEGEEPPPMLVGVAAHSRPVSDPEGATSLEMAAMIAGGKVDPDELLSEQTQQGFKSEEQDEGSVRSTPKVSIVVAPPASSNQIAIAG